MSCPTEDVIRRVRLVLEREEINQVGSFVWTHLTNLMESSSPMKQEIRHILDSESLRKEFDLDKRKFSRNIEWSTFSDTFNSGASVDSNVIWSEKSFVPRAASVNLTVDLFGHSVNLVEVGGRVEGLNQVLEKVFDTNTPSDDSKSSNRDINKIDAKVNNIRIQFDVFVEYIIFSDIYPDLMFKRPNIHQCFNLLSHVSMAPKRRNFADLGTSGSLGTKSRMLTWITWISRL